MRMIAHSIVASGWRQNVWNYNAWGVQQGSWEGPFYTMNTVETDENGNDVPVEDARWRAFGGWDEAVADFRNRINPDSRRPSYRQAHNHLYSTKPGASAAYWAALGDGNYYTARHFSDKKFGALCKAVLDILSTTTAEPA